MALFMKVVIVSVSITIGATMPQSACPATAMTEDKNICGSLRFCDGTLVPGGHLGNPSSVFGRDLMTIRPDSPNFRIIHCVAPAFAKDPCLFNPCHWNEVCYPHPLNMGYDCDYTFGYYRNRDLDRRQVMRIGTVDGMNRFQLLSLPSFEELGSKTPISSPEPQQYPSAAAHDPLNNLLYVARKDKLYGGTLVGNFKPTDFKLLSNLSGYTGIGRGGGILLDRNSTWLYIAHNVDEAIIKRYRIPSLDQEEIIYQAERKANDKAIWKGPYALAISHTHRFLFWLDSLGIKRCDLYDCHSAHRIYNFPNQISPLLLQYYQLEVDDTSAKIFWTETVEDPKIQNMYVAEFDGTLRETVWEGSKPGDIHLTTSFAGWLVIHDYASLRFWYTRVGSHVNESTRRAVLGWRWNRAPSSKKYLSTMISVY